ncbi:HlyD family secretion protein [Ancylobacter sp. A5.8]|uniref:HlyD family secretion protein n=1 Tax=Ancylobacter gelatini TaxID=2919920 RepID=UPI001F4E873A|nr:HlyD family secretion protein [Ancylobacter gelatini]MCJ8143600.1 HlyD family secretion protein [Ancylobacter gelatini]
MLSRFLRHPVLLIVAAVVTLFALYEISVRYFAYTGDAYVDSNVIVVASQIAGPVSELAVQDNQPVTAGQVLFRIDQTPFALKVKERESALDQARADLALADDEVSAAKATIVSAQAVATNANETLARVRSLAKDGFSPEAQLDVATRDVATANAAVQVAESALSVATRRVAVATADIATAEASLATAQYDLSKTVVTAPEPGRVTPFVIRVGDYMERGTKVMAIVTPERRRVVANVAERHLARIALGQRVWLTLGSDPWVLHAGRVTGISPGVARQEGEVQVLPYVEPSTDWVRLPRRFPVEVTLDEWPEGLGLFLGADARVLIWF